MMAVVVVVTIAMVVVMNVMVVVLMAMVVVVMVVAIMPMVVLDDGVGGDADDEGGGGDRGEAHMDCARVTLRWLSSLYIASLCVRCYEASPHRQITPSMSESHQRCPRTTPPVRSIVW